jgi:hypothetical protein
MEDSRCPKRARRHSPALLAFIRRDPVYSGCESELEVMLVTRLRDAGLPLGEAQVLVMPGRKFRFDRAWPGAQVAVEVQGGTWTSTGAHSRGSGIERDCLKLSIAAALGWRVLPVTRGMIESGEAVKLIRQALETRG